MGKDLKGSRTLDNLKKAFAGEAQANRRYLYFAKEADNMGYPDVANVFREIAEGETGHAFGHLEMIRKFGGSDPATGKSINSVREMLLSAIVGESYECTEMYPTFARIAREEGFEEIAEWFETLAKAERSHAEKFHSLMEQLEDSSS
jgi:rubrerythrin